MEPIAHDKAEGAKKVIVASSSSSTHGLRARSSKSSGSPRRSKNRTTRSYAGTHNLNDSLTHLSWPSTSGLGSLLSPGNGSPEKIPLGHYRTGSSFDNSLPGMQLNSNEFLCDSSVAKFNAGLFSSVTSHTSQGLDVEEAMDIDHQEVNDVAACPEEGSTSEPGASEEKSLCGGESDNVSLDVSSKEPKREILVANRKKEANEQKLQVSKTTSSTLSNKKRAIYIVLHVSTIQIGELIGKASAPVKIYAEKMFIEMDTNEGIGSQTVSYHFRIPCKDLLECKVNFGGAPLLFVVKPTAAGATAIREKCKERGQFLDPDSKDMKKRHIVLVMNYKVVPRDIRADLTELVGIESRW